MQITREELVKKIKAKKNGFFSVLFIKRTNNSRRKMICRNSVRKHLKEDAGPCTMNPDLHDLIRTYSMDSKGYRNISIEGIISAKIDGEEYVVS